MKVIYCASSINIQDLKTEPSRYASSKISRFHIKTKPYVIKEFNSVQNIEYIPILSHPEFAKLWDCMMSKITFNYNFTYLDSYKIFQDYVDYNSFVAEKINSSCCKSDLVIVNDSSLYLLPVFVKCKVAIRNLRFDGSFIERVPFYKLILKSLFKSRKFFPNKRTMDSFLKYSNASVDFSDMNKGGCYYLKNPVDKEAVNNVIRAYLADDKIKGRLESQNPKSRFVLTNVQLLHLETYIKKNPKTIIKYIRESIEIDEEQNRMIQYLAKAYECHIEIIDKIDFSDIATEMLFCDIFIGSKYRELAKLLRKPSFADCYDPGLMSRTIETNIGNRIEREHVVGEDEYLNDFMKACGYDIESRIHEDLDRAIEGNLECFGKLLEEMRAGREGKGVCGASSEAPEFGGLFKKKDDGEMAYYIKKTDKDEYERLQERLRKCGEEVPVPEAAEKECLPTEKECFVVKTPPTETRKDKTKKIRAPKPASLEEIRKRWEASNKIALIDYDGTLANIEPEPKLAKPKDELIECLREMNKSATIIISTGRSMEVVDDWFPPDLEVYAEHGACHRKDGKWEEGEQIKNIPECIEIMEYYEERTPNSLIEHKAYGCAFHYKRVKDFDVEKLYCLLRRTVNKNVLLGKGVIEVRSASKDKITRDLQPALCAGDDRTDEDMFEECSGINIRVGKGKTKAEYYVETVPDFLSLLKKIVAE